MSRIRRAASVVGALFIAVVLASLAVVPAEAAPASPSGLSPTGSTDDHTPPLAWNRVSGAVRYEVQVSKTSGYDGSNVVFARTTTNRRAAVPNRLPTGLVFWRVRGISSTGAPGSWGSTTLNVLPQPGPVPQSPANTTDPAKALQQPGNPPLLRWTDVPGASQYAVEVDTESDFIGASIYRTSTTSKVVPDAKVGGTYYWHVRAQMNGSDELTQWSPTWTYSIGSLAAVHVTAPADSPDSAMTDVALDWDPVPGAREYQVRVASDVDFSSPIETVTVVSTRYSPPVTYRNDQYFWQVRAVNLNGEYLDWQTLPKPQFKRSWPDRPTLQYPPNNIATPVGDDFFYQWSPVPHASSYQLEIGGDPNFSPGTYTTCRTDNTTYTPGSPIGDPCMPVQGQVYYWRVLPIDAPSNVPGLYSDIHAFTYDSGRVMQLAPANGATVAVPTLSWQASQDAERYRVEMKAANGSGAGGVDTYALSWTPSGKLDPAAGPFTWTVQAIDSDGHLSPKYSGRSFSLAGSPVTGAGALTPLTPASSSGSQRFPALTWEPKTGAAYYRVRMALHGSPFMFSDGESAITGTSFAYPAATDWGPRFLTSGSYDWWVEAYDAQNQSLGSGPVSSFDILNPDRTGGLQVAMTGLDLNAGKACRAFLSDTTPGATTTCDNAPTTPVLDWDPVPEAAYYLIYLSRDRSFTNLVYNGVSTSNSRWTPSQAFGPSSLPDNNAGQAYYWLVRPCKAGGKCGPDPLSTLNPSDNSFSKESPPVQLLSPGDGAGAADDVRFDWTDYRTTNAGTLNPWSATGAASQQSGQRYRIEISTKDNFSAEVYAREVDQTTFTLYDDTLPEGLLYWRVQAIDQAGNRLQWSTVRSFTKASPVPVLTSPGLNQTVSSTSPFVWNPLSFAGQYQVEVYKNNDTAFSDGNRVLAATVTQSAFTWDRPLAASSVAYVWRVRRLDSRGRPGGWSATGRFFVASKAPFLGLPAAGAYVDHQDGYFSWGPVTGAKRYRFERRVADSSGIVETADTSGLSWTTEDIPSGSWEWRVTAYDAVDQVLGVSAWSPFLVDATRPTVTPKTPTVRAYRTANFTARFSEPVQNVTSATMRLFVRGNTRPLSARVTLSADKRSATLNPTYSMRVGQVYTVQLGTGITDLNHNPLVGTYWRVTAR